MRWRVPSNAGGSRARGGSGAMALMHAWTQPAAALTHETDRGRTRPLDSYAKGAARGGAAAAAPAPLCVRRHRLRCVCATGWHQDLALRHGTRIATRPSSGVRRLRESEKGRRARDAASVCRGEGQVLERRLALRSDPSSRVTTSTKGVAVGALSPEQYELLAAASSQNQRSVRRCMRRRMRRHRHRQRR